MRFAKDLECHLVGIAPTRLINLPVSPEAAASFANFTAHAWDTLRDRAEQTTQRFSGRKSFEAFIDESEVAPSLLRHAHCSDLTALTQADPSTPGDRLAQALVEQVVL